MFQEVRSCHEIVNGQLPSEHLKNRALRQPTYLDAPTMMRH